MMYLRCALASLWLGLFSRLTTGHAMLTTTVAPSADEKQLQELQRINQKLNSMQQTMQPFLIRYSVLGGLESSTVNNKLHAMEIELEATKTKLKTMEKEQSANGGSTYVRWGRKTCTNSSRLVYSGVTGGSHYTHSGGAANLLCLPSSPQFDGTPVPRTYGYVYGAEYDQIPNHHDHDVPCSVCRAAQSTTIMIPATHECPAGWNPQYTGHLISGDPKNSAASQYVCLDRYPEHATNGRRNDQGNLLFYTVTACGSLPCPPYRNHQVVLCVVCSQ